MSQKILVTGAAGFIGGHLCQSLSDDSSIEVIGVDNLRAGDRKRISNNATLLKIDINRLSLADWINLLDEVDYVFHLAAEKYNSSRSTPDLLLDTNVISTQRLFRAAAMCDVKRIVFTSSLYAYGSMGPEIMRESDLPHPSTLYGSSKLMGENMLRSIDRELGLSWNVARLFFIYGPHQFADGGYKSVIVSNFERIINGQKPRIFGDGLQSLDYVYVDDCIKALLCLATSEVDKTVVNVASGIATSVTALTRHMTSLAGTTNDAEFDAPDWTHGSLRRGDNELIKEKFGWSPSVSLEEGLQNVFDWYSQS
jgi:UDP-glucose 4-epimerase